MRRLVLTIAGGLLLIVGPTTVAAARPATITITAQGATMEFRTLGPMVSAFGLGDGAKRTFKLNPGEYVVVQAPPVAGHQLQIRCSDDAPNVHQLDAAEQITCTFIATPL